MRGLLEELEEMMKNKKREEGIGKDNECGCSCSCMWALVHPPLFLFILNLVVQV